MNRRHPSIPVADRLVFDTTLGWVAVLGDLEGWLRLTFGHADPAAALEALHGPGESGDHVRRPDRAQRRWIDQVCRFAEGQRQSLDSIPIVMGRRTPFQRRVLDACRAIPYGQTLSYGELATIAGAPGAARAVGSVMRSNDVPLIIPCHRVIAAGGRLGGYSGRDGVRMKERLLRMEAAAIGA